MHARVRDSIAAVLILAACTSSTAAKKGSLVITVSGLPSGPAAILVTGPSSYSQQVTATTTLTDLNPGTYLVAAQNVTVGGGTYAPTPSSTGVAITTTQLTATVAYSLSSGGLALTVSGLPGGVNASVGVTGPGGFNQSATASQTWSDITTGSYVITANTVTSGSSTYGGTPSTQTIVVPASLTAATATETYSLMTGSIGVTIAGLPGGLNPSVTVTGPFAYSHLISASGLTTLSALPLGTYTITASNVSNATATYAPAAVSQTVTLSSSSLSGAKTVTYGISTGSLAVTVAGLPGGLNAAVTVTGPSSFSQTLTATTTINKLVPGTYTIAASSVSNGTSYNPTPTSQTAAVSASVTAATATVTYSVAPSLNLLIDGMYITQSTQSYTDTVPLIVGKDGYLRVFVKANIANSVAPKVRVRWYTNGTLFRTDTISAPSGAVPTAITENVLNSSWNLAVPKAVINMPMLSVLADVDPANLISEGNEGDNDFPVSGTPLALNVKTLSIFHQMIIPVKTKKDGLLGNVTAGNQASFLVFLQKVHPVPSTTQILHATYTTIDSVDVLQSGDGNNMWETILSEIWAVRSAEAVTPLLDSTYYFGVVHPNYGSGVAGLGYIGNPAAIGWDNGQNDQILAHETGHNWGRNHSPGCGAAFVDPNYPNATGNLDAYGLDVATTTLYTPAADFDLMSYCRPYWISNFTYIGVMNYRLSSPDIAAAAQATGPEKVLLVWGHMVNGKLVLEPGFEITARARMPEGHGAYRIEGLDANGAPIFSYAFEGIEVADGRAPSRGFAFNIPIRNFDISRLSTLRLAGQGTEVRREGGPVAAAMSVGSAPPSGLLARIGAHGTHVTWNTSTYPMAMVRDRRTGQVLSFARGGSVDVDATDLEVVLSNGVRSVTERVTAK